MSKGPFSIFDHGPDPFLPLAVLGNAVLWSVIAVCLWSLMGCAPSRQFVRADLNHYASESETFVSSASATVGRYFTLVPEKLEAEAYAGTWYDLDAQRPFGTIGAAVTWYAPLDTSVSIGADLFAPEDGGELEYYGSVSLEKTWP